MLLKVKDFQHSFSLLLHCDVWSNVILVYEHANLLDLLFFSFFFFFFSDFGLLQCKVLEFLE